MEVVLSEGWRVGGRIRWVFNEPGLSMFILKKVGEWIELRAAAQIVWVQLPQWVKLFARWSSDRGHGGEHLFTCFLLLIPKLLVRSSKFFLIRNRKNAPDRINVMRITLRRQKYLKNWQFSDFPPSFANIISEITL